MSNEHREQAREIMHSVVWTQHEDSQHEHFILLEDKRHLEKRIAGALSSRDAKIREVLEGLATYRNPLCWCPPNTEAEPHTEACRATTVLYANSNRIK